MTDERPIQKLWGVPHPDQTIRAAGDQSVVTVDFTVRVVVVPSVAGTLLTSLVEPGTRLGIEVWSGPDDDE